MNELDEVLDTIGRAARDAAVVLACADSAAKSLALVEAAKAVRASVAEILAANELDLVAAKERGFTDAMIDRLELDAGRIEAIAEMLDTVAGYDDPVGRILSEWDRPNGLKISRVAVPLGVIGIIFESRPNVTADAGALALKSGNAVILRGGSDSFHSCRAIHACMADGLRAADLPEAAIQLIPVRDRAAVGWMLQASEYIDVIVPRGGKSLIERVQTESRVPVLAHLEGICHTYIDGGADADKAMAITVNAKLRRTGICGATETLLVDRAAVHMLAGICLLLTEGGCELRGDTAAQEAFPGMAPASEADWDTEYLDSIISIRVVDGVEGALAHIARHGSGHTESIVTEDAEAAERFLSGADSAIVMHNTSTQFADGGEFGMGAEIGISTGRLHARGPVGAEQLTTFKYVVRGEGQLRP